MQLLYVDRIRNNGERIVTRQKPTFKGWTNLNLKQRQEEEMIPGAFGTGEIMIPARIEFQEVQSKLKSFLNYYYLAQITTNTFNTGTQ